MSHFRTVQSNYAGAVGAEVDNRIDEQSVCHCEIWLDILHHLSKGVCEGVDFWLGLLELLGIVDEELKVIRIHGGQLTNEHVLHFQKLGLEMVENVKVTLRSWQVEINLELWNN